MTSAGPKGYKARITFASYPTSQTKPKRWARRDVGARTVQQTGRVQLQQVSNRCCFWVLAQKLPVSTRSYLARTPVRNTHAPARSYVRSYVRAYVRVYVCSYVRTYVRTLVRSYARTYARTYERTNARTFVRTFAHPCTSPLANDRPAHHTRRGQWPHEARKEAARSDRHFTARESLGKRYG